MAVPRKRLIRRTTQFVLMGLEWHRLIAPFKEYGHNKIIFFRNGDEPEDHEKYEQYHDSIEESIKKIEHSNYSKQIISYMNFEDTFQRMLELMKKENDTEHDVVVNISAGSKIAAGAAMVAASITGNTVVWCTAEDYITTKSKELDDIKDSYTYIDQYDVKHDLPKPPKGIVLTSMGVGEIVETTSFPVILPEGLKGEILLLLNKNNGEISASPGQIRDFLEDANINDDAWGRAKQDRGKAVSVSLALDWLDCMDLIIMKRAYKKRRLINITDSGRMIAKALEIMNVPKVK